MMHKLPLLKLTWQGPRASLQPVPRVRSPGMAHVSSPHATWYLPKHTFAGLKA